jgi:hypothetical protein
MNAPRPLTVAELIDYLRQFDGNAAVFLDYGPFNVAEVNKHEDEGKPYILLDQVDFRVEQA